MSQTTRFLVLAAMVLLGLTLILASQLLIWQELKRYEVLPTTAPFIGPLEVEQTATPSATPKGKTASPSSSVR